MPKDAGGLGGPADEPWEVGTAGPLGGWDCPVAPAEFSIRGGRPRLRLGGSCAWTGAGTGVTFCANGATFAGRGAGAGGGAKVTAGAPPFDVTAAR
jgi:hypothetical protein